ncbi:MAG TPA: serine peptidase, partial [Burkholderiales bacterium]|nr:serine peptidase [Burkholderiales bacterium]
MTKRFFYAVFLFISVVAAAEAQNNLPDFTQIVAKEGPAVVNISTTHIVHGTGPSQAMPGLSPNDPF